MFGRSPISMLLRIQNTLSEEELLRNAAAAGGADFADLNNLGCFPGLEFYGAHGFPTQEIDSILDAYGIQYEPWVLIDLGRARRYGAGEHRRDYVFTNGVVEFNYEVG